MKKLLPLLLGICCFTNNAVAQSQDATRGNIPVAVPAMQGTKCPASYSLGNNALPPPMQVSNPLERIIGVTTYDLQSNGSVGGRITNLGNGKVAAVWTHSSSGTPALTFFDRGTGYAYYDGSTWYDNPSQRIEAHRTGWPSLAVLANGKELIACQNTDAQVEDLQFNSRPTAGTGAWTQNYSNLASPAADGNWWPRIVAGGANGNSVHAISLTYPPSSGGVAYQGLNGALTYSRSINGGVSWDIQHSVLPGMTSSQYLGFSADNYDCANSKGDTIAFVVGGVFQDVFLMKSVNNGTSWTKTIVHQFAQPFYDEGSHLVDTTLSNDGSLSVILDNSGMAHVFFGALGVLNDDTTDAQHSSFPFSSAIYYWNESYGANAPQPILGMVDRDNDGFITINSFYDLSNGYSASLASQPSAGVDADGNLYLAYNSICEDLSDGNHLYRHIYLSKSTDGGSSWSMPVDLNYTAEDDYTENVFATLAPRVDDYLHIVYQRDYEAGMATRPSPGDHAITTNEIVYVKTHISLNVGTIVAVEDAVVGGVDLYPNPAADKVAFSFGAEKSEQVVLAIYDLTGKMVGNSSYQASVGVNQLTLDVSHLNSGIYFIDANVGDQRISRKLVVE